MSYTDSNSDEEHVVELENRVTDLENRVLKLEYKLKESQIVIENLKKVLDIILTTMPEAKKLLENEYNKASKENE